MMPVPRRLTAVALALAIWSTAGTDARAIDIRLDQAALFEAIDFGRQATRDLRTTFHEAYQATPGELVRRISLVTEYRRVVLLMEEKRRQLDRNYGITQMNQALTPWRGLLDVIVELQFHPQNTYVGVPPIDVLIVPLDRPGTPTPLVAEATDRLPHFGRYWDPPPMDSPWWPFPTPGLPVIRGSEPLTGGWIEARFDAATFKTGRYDVLVKDGAKTLARATFDFGALR